MKKFLRLCSLFVFAIAISGNSWAQERSVTGKVTGIEDGAALPGVNVVIKGTATGTITDFDGNYTLNVSDGMILIYSFIGYVSEEVEVGSRAVIDIQLSSDVKQLSEVVVTAFGIERESRKLGYGISTVESEELLVARESNLANSLQGKVAGVNIFSGGGGVGGSAKVLIRGLSSITNNQPLWVVDGVPISDGNFASGGSGVTGTAGISGGFDSFNTAGVINPDDVESINVLKGAAASALYGTRASNGVIVVTTKRGKGNSTSISFNSSVRFDKIFKTPDFQNEYSGGDLGKYDSSAAVLNWGARIAGQQVSALPITHQPGILRAYPDNIDDFYETGVTQQHNIAISSSKEGFDYRLSVTNLQQSGILPSSDLDRITASLNAGVQHSEKLSTRFGIQFIRSLVDGAGAQGTNDPNVLAFTQFVRTTDFNQFKPWIDNTGAQINNINNSTNNPFWIRNENNFKREDDRLIGNMQLNYEPIENLNITGILGFDTDTDEFFQSNRAGTIGTGTGDFTNTIVKSRQTDLNARISYEGDITQDISYTVRSGYNFNRRIREVDANFGDQLSVVNLFDPGNVATNSPSRDFTERILHGIYGEAEFSYKNWLTLNLTARNDWSSTLPLADNSFFYPSVSTSFVFTDAFSIANDILSYGKLRASWAQVGGDTDPYQIDFRFFPVNTVFGQFGTAIQFPFDGNFAFEKTNRLPPSNLVPENKTSIEIGSEFQLFDGRVGLDVTWYQTKTTDQIVPVPTAQSTGFTTALQNLGETETNGLEISLNADVLELNNGFKWNTLFTFSKSEFTINKLAPGVERITIGSGFNSVTVVGEVGTGFQLRATDVLRDSVSGRPIIDPETGLRQAGDPTNFGDVVPDFNLGWVNTVSFKGFTLRWTIDYRHGGTIRSASIDALRNAGAVEETAVGREGTLIDLEGVIDNGDGTFRDNDIPARSTRDFWSSLNNNNVSGNGVFDATFVKLREVGFSYTLPKGLISKTPFKAVTVGLEARNLALLYTKIPHIDPEVAGLLGSGSDAFGIERNSTPATRSVGFNVRLGF